LTDEFESLRQKRINWVQANRENGFEEGIKGLLSDLYPDNAHFIFELLQNAEDACATEVSFDLSSTMISVNHNGTKLFNIEDVRGITGIGISTKRDDPTSIGKFGVGFKAVFAYTNSPEIYSGNYHFCINDLVVPEVVQDRPSNHNKYETLFCFPFDHPNKLKETAIDEITKGLICLGDNVLLFLNNIRRIEYNLCDGTKGYLERTALGDKKIEIRVSHPGSQEYTSNWLRFEEEYLVQTNGCVQKSFPISVAYKLNQKPDKQQSSWEIVPIKGQVSIYFPANKEVSNLCFHINAPFASTIARDSVKDRIENNELRDRLAKLVVKSLFEIRDQRFLTVDFLAVMPNSEDKLDDFYSPIRDAIIKAFREEKLTPTKNRSHAPAKLLYRSQASISKVIDEDGLSLFTQKSPPLWAANPKQLNQREDKFLESLGICRWEKENLFSELVSNDPEKKNKFQSWLSAKPDLWMTKFYEMLSGELDRVRYSWDRPDFSKWQIVRVNSITGDSLVFPNESQLLPEEKIDFPPGIKFVKKSVYCSGKSQKVNKSVYEFLHLIGVKPFNVNEAKEKALLEIEAQDAKDLGLDKYQNHIREIDTEEHITDIKNFIEYWNKKAKSAHNLFRNLKFLYVTRKGIKYWGAPIITCLDMPYMETELFDLAPIYDKYILWEEYKDYFSEKELQIFLSFIIEMGVQHKKEPIVVEEVKNSNRVRQKLGPKFWKATISYYEVNIDYQIKNLQAYLENKKIVSSFLIWDTIIHADPKVAFASYRPNNKNSIETTKSLLVEMLENAEWVPDKEGNFCLPSNLTKDQLHDRFIVNSGNGLLSAIGFGNNQNKEKIEKNKAEELILKFTGRTLNQIEQIVELQNQGLIPKEFPQFPVRNSVNPERRKEKITNKNSRGTRKHFEPRSRSTRVTKAIIDPNSWLINQYTNENEQMVCQICKREMPFRKRDNQYYFEAIEMFSEDYFPNEAEEQYLALCPECAARYNEFVKKSNEVMEDLKIRIMISENSEIQLKLGELNTSIRFVETHWVDLKTILEVEN
jgi:hypothetical protein